MKKVFLVLVISVFLPINVFAYSLNLIPGGESIGIKINTEGLVVNGFYKVNDEYIGKRTFAIGDRIIKINGIVVNNSDEMANVIDENLEEDYVPVEFIRNNKLMNGKLYLSLENNLYKTGLYIKDSIVGIGTLTYIDPVTKIYGALGHEIQSNNERIEIKDGDIFSSRVTSISKSRNGFVGSKNASIAYNNVVGNIYENTTSGIFGKYTGELPNKETLEVGEFSDIHVGDAYILTVVDNSKIEKFDIKIVNKYNRQKDTQKAFSFEITDKEL